MTNLNYLLLKVLEEKLTKEEAVAEVGEFITLNNPKINHEKELISWTAKNEKVLSKSGKVGDYQVFTNNAILYATKNEHKEVAFDKEFPNCEALINCKSLSKGTPFNFRELFNASQIVKNKATDTLILEFADCKIKLQVKAIEEAYKISGIREATLKVNLAIKLSPIYLFAKNGDIALISPCRPCDDDDKKVVVYKVCENGSIAISTNEKLASAKIVEVAEPKKEAVKVLPKVRNINDNEKATSKQVYYLVLLTGKTKAEFEQMTKNEASKLITKIKVANAKTCEA